MPELPEVETVCRSLRRQILRHRIVEVQLERPEPVTERSGTGLRRLEGCRVETIRRVGKNMLLDTSGDLSLLVHLGMSGRMECTATGAPLLPHTHVRLRFEDLPERELRYHDVRRFGYLDVMPTAEAAQNPHLAILGPDALAISREELAARLDKSARPVKNALMDQTLIAGLGNIYVDEILHLAQIHPLTPANRLSAPRVMVLHEAIQTILTRAIEQGGSTIRDYRDSFGNFGGYQRQHRVYGRAGQDCPSCGAAIQRIVLGGRSTHFCAKCQYRLRRPSHLRRTNA